MNLNVALIALIDKIEKLTEALFLVCKLLTILTAVARSKKYQKASLTERKLWTQMQVISYLNISQSTYKRRVKDGVLKPMTLTGDDRYYEEDLAEALELSRQKGKL